MPLIRMQNGDLMAVSTEAFIRDFNQRADDEFAQIALKFRQRTAPRKTRQASKRGHRKARS